MKINIGHIAAIAIIHPSDDFSKIYTDIDAEIFELKNGPYLEDKVLI